MLWQIFSVADASGREMLPILSQVLQHLWIQSPDSFFWTTTPPEPVVQLSSPIGVEARQGLVEARQRLVEARQRLILALRDALYRQCFARPFIALQASLRAGIPVCVESDDVSSNLAHQLSAANCGRTTWQTGWCVQRVDRGGSIVAVKGDVQRRVQVGDYAMTFSEELLPRVGGAVMLCRRKESLTLQAGVYYAFGDALPELDQAGEVLRLYFHASQAAVVPVFETITKDLNTWRVPFTLKTMMRSQDCDRTDATVLYLPKRCYPRFVDLIHQRSALLSAQLKPEVPLFTKPLCSGIGLAESPVTPESFGLHRCRLLAEAIVMAWTNGRQDEAARLQATEQRFVAEGLSLNQPYLNPGSEDIYFL